MAMGISNANSTDLATVDAVEASLGVRPATWTVWSTWGDRGGKRRCTRAAGSCAFPTQLIRGLRERRITPVVYWQPTDPSDPSAGVYERYRNIAAGRHDRYIRAWAKAARDFGGPVIVRFAHEMNGTWFPWSLTNHDNSPERFKQAWRHVVTIFRNVGARNVRFLWTPFQRCTTCSTAEYADFYPGNRYVDYVGVTAINWGDIQWTSFPGLIDEPLTTLRALTRTDRRPWGKPVILPEIASHWAGGDKAAWLNEAYLGAYARWPNIRAMAYFDYDMTFAGQPDWRLAQPGDGSAFAAYKAIATRPEFRAAMPLRPAPGPRRWRLMPLAEPPGPHLIVVAQDGSGGATTIAAAVAQAADGDTVLLRPGTYDESVTVDKTITIGPESGPGTVVVQPTGGAAFTLLGSNATLDGLTLRGPLGTVLVSGGAPTLEGLVFEGVIAPDPAAPRVAAIDIGAGSTALVRGTTISAGDIGVRIIGAAPRLEGNAITANTSGMLLGAGATPSLVGNTICANATDVELVDGATLPDRTMDAPCPTP
jgi:hypothetical protein